MISPDAERIIRDAAIAQRAYSMLIARAAENPRFRLELIDARVMADQEARGEPRQPPPPPDMMEPIAVAVDRELEAMRPDVEFRVATWRATRRLAGCGYVQLSLSWVANMRRAVRRLFRETELTMAEFAEILGIDETTVADHLGDGKIPKSRQRWYQHVLHIAVNRETVVITMRRGTRGAKSKRSLLKHRLERRRKRAKGRAGITR